MKKMDFDSLTIETLNDISTFLYAIQSIARMGSTFSRNPNFDWASAELKVLELSVLIKHLNCDLMMALHTKSSIRKHAVMKAQIKLLPDLNNIVQIVTHLCQEEIRILETNFIRETALLPIKSIRDTWTEKWKLKIQSQKSPKEKKIDANSSNQEKLKSMCSGKIDYKLAAELISKETNRPTSVDAIKSWTCDSNSKRARPCPDWAIVALEKSLHRSLAA